VKGRHEKAGSRPSFHPLRPALLGSHSGEIKDFAVFSNRQRINVSIDGQTGAARADRPVDLSFGG
jgi:hypothetical protein